MKKTNRSLKKELRFGSNRYEQKVLKEQMLSAGKEKKEEQQQVWWK